MNNTPRVVKTLKAEVYGQKSTAVKSNDKNLWITKILDSVPISKSLYYTDENYKE